MSTPRNLLPELMDDPHLDPNKHRRALAGLRRVNIVSRTGSKISKTILDAATRRGLKQLSILDLGCGSGDVAASVYRNVSRKIPCSVTGWDISATAIDTARNLQPSNVQFDVCDVFQVSSASESQFDVVYCSLFLHHFTQEQSVTLLKTMRSLAKHIVIVDDLLRSTLGLVLAKIGCRLVSSSPIVNFDGPQSVRAAYTLDEMSDLARSADLIPYRMQRHWPERFMFTWEAP